MMGRSFSETNNRNKRIRKKFFYISSEGKNKTEHNYFKHYNSSDNNYVIHYIKCKSTDAVNIVKTLIKVKKDNLKDPSAKGDLYYSFFDTDNDLSKNTIINNAFTLAKANDIQTIYSAPCFEKFYIDHFCFTTKGLKNGNDAINELKKHIPSYQKNSDIFEILENYTDKAILNGEKCEKYFNSLNKINWDQRDSYSEVFKFLKIIKNI